jgi:ribosomal protein S18 acetylase RimI-like enzyme
VSSELRQPIRTARLDDIPRLKVALGRSFDADPYMNWFVLPGRKRAAHMHAIFGMFLASTIRTFNCTFTDESTSACAIWIPPGEKVFSKLRDLPLLIRLIPKIGAANLFGRLHANDVMERHHPPMPHYHLLAVGVLPEMQGRGLGKNVLQPMLERCEREGLPAYLETSVESNLHFYTRLGFSLYEQYFLPHGGPKIWTMLRQPPGRQ